MPWTSGCIVKLPRSALIICCLLCASLFSSCSCSFSCLCRNTNMERMSPQLRLNQHQHLHHKLVHVFGSRRSTCFCSCACKWGPAAALALFMRACMSATISSEIVVFLPCHHHYYQLPLPWPLFDARLHCWCCLVLLFRCCCCCCSSCGKLSNQRCRLELWFCGLWNLHYILHLQYIFVDILFVVIVLLIVRCMIELRCCWSFEIHWFYHNHNGELTGIILVVERPNCMRSCRDDTRSS